MLPDRVGQCPLTRELLDNQNGSAVRMFRNYSALLQSQLAWVCDYLKWSVQHANVMDQCGQNGWHRLFTKHRRIRCDSRYNAGDIERMTSHMSCKPFTCYLFITSRRHIFDRLNLQRRTLAGVCDDGIRQG